MDGLLLSSNELQNIEKNGDNVQKAVNVYKQSIFSEVTVCFKLIHSMKTRITEFIIEIDNKPLTLQRILEIIERFENLNINSPLLTFSAWLELLLKTLEEWQSFGHREIKMLDYGQSNRVDF